MARADNHDGRIRIWHVNFLKDMPADTHVNGRGVGDNRNNINRKNTNGKGGKGGRAVWPKDRPDFLRFVLYKENVDTSTATKDIVRIGRLNPKRGVSYAGMKDKRGVTSQFCSVYRIEKEELLALNANKGGNSGGGGNTSTRGFNVIRLGNFHYSSDEVKLGTLAGNRFDIVLRNVDVGDVPGGSDKATHVKCTLEKASKALQQVGFINYFGMQRFGKSNDTHEVGIAILKGDYEAAIDIIMREKADEQMPRVVSARKAWASRFDSINVANDEDAAKDAEMKCARSILNELGRFMGSEKSVINSLSRKPRDYKRAYSCIAKNMRSMYLHAVQSVWFNKVASYRIETGGSTEVRVGDLVLIEDASLAEGGSGTSGLKGKKVKTVEEQDIERGVYDISQVVLPLVGSKISYPKGACGEKYDELLKQDGIDKSAFERIGTIDREIALGGDYRRLMCKPSDVSFEIKSYTDPVQPLVKTDLMNVNGTELAAATISTDKEVHDADTDMMEDNLVGLVIGFTLPPSSYATIALRELTKRPTSSEYQGKLQLSGKCEGNID